MARVLFFDIDGTLIDTQGNIPEIPEGAKRAMKELQRQGDLLFIASGRPYAFIPKMLTDFGFDGMILCNGAHVELQGQVIYHQPVNLSKIKELVGKLDEFNYEYIIETKRDSYIKSEFTGLKNFLISCKVNEEYLIEEFEQNTVLNNCLKLEANVPSNCQDMIKRLIDGHFNYDQNGTENVFEVYSNVISKATGIKKVLKFLNLNSKDSFAFGDGLNDLEMIKAVGTGVAMGNAVDELKAVSNIVCDSIDNNGLEKILNKLFN